MNKHLRNLLSQFGLAKSQSEIDWQKHYEDKKRRLEAGEEIEPPWGDAPSWNNPARFVGNSLNEEIWDKFWEGLSDEKKRAYLKKHKPTPEDWYQVFVVARTVGEEKREEWLLNQKEKLEHGEEVEPPWVTFPISLPSVGWDDYFLEKWKLEVWIPFWDKLNEKERAKYLEKWKPPGKEWKENIEKKWVGEIKKTEKWFERQRFFLEQRGDVYVEPILLPRFAFPEILAKNTVWDEHCIDRWMREIWLPFWNSLSEEQQDEELKHLEVPNEYELQILRKYKVKNLKKFTG